MTIYIYKLTFSGQNFISNFPSGSKMQLYDINSNNFLKAKLEIFFPIQNDVDLNF